MVSLFSDTSAHVLILMSSFDNFSAIPALGAYVEHGLFFAATPSLFLSLSLALALALTHTHRLTHAPAEIEQRF